MILKEVLLFQGFERIYDSLPDLAIDVPAAYSILERFVVMSRFVLSTYRIVKD
jgi:hypothetical protein